MSNGVARLMDFVILGCIAALVAMALLSSVLIFLSEGDLVFDFTSAGFSMFLKLYSFPVSLFSAAVALFSVWAVVDNVNRARLASVRAQLVSDLFRCEDDIKDILSKRFTQKEVVLMIEGKLAAHERFGSIHAHFGRVTNPDLSIDEIIPHLSKFGVVESNGVYHVLTQNLTLRLVRYSLALLQLSKLREDKMFLRYHATKYISLMLDLFKYKSQIDLRLIEVCYQLSSVRIEFDYSFPDINGADHVSVSDRFRERYLQLMGAS